jgi:hypothetical protein
VRDLQQLAKKRDDVMFMKEAAYSTYGMRNRSAPLDESADPGALLDVPSFLRRKRSQGKAEPEQPPKP